MASVLASKFLLCCALSEDCLAEIGGFVQFQEVNFVFSWCHAAVFVVQAYKALSI